MISTIAAKRRRYGAGWTTRSKMYRELREFHHHHHH
jgi:hypothetical protein